jgi:chaperone modulatory protein CbpM
VMPQQATPQKTVRRYALVRVPARLDLGSFARAGGLHPDLVRRLVALGLIEATRDASGELRFSPDQLSRVARIQRLRARFSVNYAALDLVLELLDRIDALEAASRTRVPRRPGG